MRIYRGRRRQRGYGVGAHFASFFRKAIPVLKKAGFSTTKHWMRQGGDLLEEMEKSDDLADWQNVVKKHVKKAAKKSINPLLDLGVNAAKRGIKDVLSDDEFSSSPAAKKVKTSHEPDIFDEDD